MFKLIADLITYNLLQLPYESRWGEIVHFFIYDVTKILFMVTFIMFFIAYIRANLDPEKVKKALSHEWPIVSNITAAMFGAVSPFCSCSSIPNLSRIC